jgi:hypothetical protein
MTAVPEGTQAWCRPWFREGAKWEDPRRVRLMLDVLVQHGLHAIPEPSFTWDMRAGVYNCYFIRLVWVDDDHGKTDLFFNLNVDDTISWDLSVRRGHDCRTTSYAATLQEAEQEVGVNIRAVYGQK